MSAFGKDECDDERLATAANKSSVLEFRNEKLWEASIMKAGAKKRAVDKGLGWDD